MSGDGEGKSTDGTDGAAQGRGGLGRRLLVGFASVLGVLVVIGIGIAALLYPSFVEMQSKSKLSEVPISLKGISSAQTMYNDSIGLYVAAEPCPSLPPVAEVRDWPDGCAGFEAVSWYPLGGVRGVYWVEVAADGTDFIAYGVSDVDGDGSFATYTANKSGDPVRVTPEGIY